MNSIDVRLKAQDRAVQMAESLLDLSTTEEERQEARTYLQKTCTKAKALREQAGSSVKESLANAIRRCC